MRDDPLAPPPSGARGRRRRAAGLLGVLLLVALPLVAPSSAGAAPQAGGANAAQLVLHILDYVAVDYGGAVRGGRVLAASEYQEQVDFVRQAVTTLATLPARPERPALLAQGRRLRALVEAKGSAEDVARVAGALGWAIVRAYAVTVAPARPPDVHAAAGLYNARCAACHGPDGHGDGPAGRGLDPPPANFHDRERFSRKSLYALYSSITLGVEGTAMRRFATLSDAQRWGLAFHVAGLGMRATERRRGAAVWQSGRGHAIFPALTSVATTTPREAKARDGDEGVALLAYLEARPDLVTAPGGAALAHAVRGMADSVEAYRRGRGPEAQRLAASSYLDGFELLEPSLDAVDHRLRITVETEMTRYRALLRDGASLTVVEAQAGRIQRLLAEAEHGLAGGGLAPGPAFVSAFIILVREGLEAILVVAAIVAILVRTGRREALGAVHAGWVGALGFGGVTWSIASSIVSVSGATRELTEGVTGLVAAAVLLYVGFWMHDKAHTHRWQDYLHGRLEGALGRRAGPALATVSFLAVYREVFETVLFYQALWLQAGAGSGHALLAGIGAGALALVVLGWLVVRGSLRLPLGLFFGATSLVLALLGVVVAGKGIAALQAAAVLRTRPLAMRSVPLLGIYADAVGLGVQVALLVLIAAAILRQRRASRAASPQGP